MTITDLLTALPGEALRGSVVPVPEPVGRTPATGVVYDSRKASPGVVFVAPPVLPSGKVEVTKT